MARKATSRQDSEDMRMVVSQLSENMIRLRSEVMELKRRAANDANGSNECAKDGEAAKGKAGEKDSPSPAPSSIAVSQKEIHKCVAELLEGMTLGLSEEAARKLLTEADGKAWRYADDIAKKYEARIAGIERRFERRCSNIEERIKAVVEPKLADLSKQTGTSCNPKQIFKEFWRESEADAGLIQSLKILLYQLASCLASVLIAAFRILVFSERSWLQFLSSSAQPLPL